MPVAGSVTSEGRNGVAHWPSQYCWPEGFMRRWHAAATWEWHFIVTPSLVTIQAGVARNFITNIQGWFVHGAFEYSSKLQTIGIAERLAPGDFHLPPRRDRPRRNSLR